MYPSKSNANATASGRDAEASKFTSPSSASREKDGALSYQSSNPSAPLLQSRPHDPAAQDLDPPPYSSVVADDSSDWKNRSSSFSGGNTLRPYPPASPHISGANSSSSLNNRAPYPTGPGPSSFGFPAQAPYPTGSDSGPGRANNAPYPPEPGQTFGSANQAPYPMGSMPMPKPLDTGRPIGFTVPVTTEPKSGHPGYPSGGHDQGPSGTQTAPYPINGNQSGSVGLVTPGEINQYAPTPRYVAYEFGQQRQPNTIYVVQKDPRQNIGDNCCLWACCMACCYCICEGINTCGSPDP